MTLPALERVPEPTDGRSAGVALNDLIVTFREGQGTEVFQCNHTTDD